MDGRHGGGVMMGLAGAALGVGVWVFLVLPPVLRLADSPGDWLVALSVGVVGPVLVLWQLDRLSWRRERARQAERDAGALEQELLAALAAHGPLTPAGAALRTSLTLDEAGPLLEALASMGTVRATDGADGRTYVLATAADPTRPAQPEAATFVGEPGVPGASPDGLVAAGPALPAEPLSERELDVLALAATGQTNREIAHALYVSVGTVKSHTHNIYRKLGVRNRTEAIARARTLALV